MLNHRGVFATSPLHRGLSSGDKIWKEQCNPIVLSTYQIPFFHWKLNIVQSTKWRLGNNFAKKWYMAFQTETTVNGVSIQNMLKMKPKKGSFDQHSGHWTSTANITYSLLLLKCIFGRNINSRKNPMYYHWWTLGLRIMCW